MEKPKLALRVLRRSNKYLALLWRRIDGATPFDAEIVYTRLDSKSPKKTITIEHKHISIDEPVDGEERPNVNADTVVCIVREKDAGIDPADVYYVRVRIGQHEEAIRLSPAGVFPSHEKEDRDKNVHHYAWDDEKAVWRKVCGVRGPNGKWYMGVVLVDAATGQAAHGEDDE
jgi:hypothetical protein